MYIFNSALITAQQQNFVSFSTPECHGEWPVICKTAKNSVACGRLVSQGPSIVNWDCNSPWPAHGVPPYMQFVLLSIEKNQCTTCTHTNTTACVAGAAFSPPAAFGQT